MKGVGRARPVLQFQDVAIGGLQVTPTEAPKKLHGLRYSARGWLPFERLGAAEHSRTNLPKPIMKPAYRG